MQKQKNPSPIQLDPNIIVQAFQVLGTPNNQKQIIKNADNYIQQCENNPQFPLLLLQIFSQHPNPQTKWQILIHLKNILKRNWTTKKRSSQPYQLTSQIKHQIKQNLLQLYKLQWKLYYKQFNQIFQYLAYQDFPLNYPQLNQFIKQILISVSSCKIQQLLTLEQLIPYLSLIKITYKQYALRRTLHTVQYYKKYMLQNLYTCIQILNNIGYILKMFKTQSQQSIDVKLGNKFLECSRKIDKILLYNILCISSDLQYDQNIVQVVKLLVEKIGFLLEIRKQGFNQNIQLNILALCQGIGKLQTYFPFIFTSFLTQYLQFIIMLLFKYQFKNQQLSNQIIQINSSPFKTCAYYTNPQKYKSFIQCKPSNQHLQQICYTKYTSVYTSQNILLFLQKIVTQLMIKHERQDADADDQIMFQQSKQIQGIYNKCILSNLIVILTTMMQRYKKQSKQFSKKIIQYLLQHKNQTNKITATMYQLIFLLPKILNQQQQIQLQSILILMQQSFKSENYNITCRIIRIYHQYFNRDILVLVFKYLLVIISKAMEQGSKVRHHTVYQAAVCIHILLKQYPKIQFPVQKISKCLYKIFQLIQIYKTNVSHLWNLLYLLVKILKQLKKQVILRNLYIIMYHINIINNIKDNRSNVFQALLQLLYTITILINTPDQYNIHTTIKVLGIDNYHNNYIDNNKNIDINNYYQMNLQLLKNNYYQSCLQTVLYMPQQSQQIFIEQQTKNCQYMLWLCVLRNVNGQLVNQSLAEKLLYVYQHLHEQVLNQSPSRYCQILEHYLISQIPPSSEFINSHLLLTIHKQYIHQLSLQTIQDIRLAISFLNLYYTYILIKKQPILQILQSCIYYICQLLKRVSPHINTLRTLCMVIINYHVLEYGGQKIYGIFTHKFNNNYKYWFWPYIQALQYINNKYSCKVITYGILKQFKLFTTIIGQEIVKDNIPFDKIIKFITLYTNSMEVGKMQKGYVQFMIDYMYLQRLEMEVLASSGKIGSKNTNTMNTMNNIDTSINKANKQISRKFKLHVNPLLCEIDLNQLYRIQITDLFKLWDWAEDDLQSRYSDKLVHRIVSILNGTHKNYNWEEEDQKNEKNKGEKIGEWDGQQEYQYMRNMVSK